MIEQPTPARRQIIKCEKRFDFHDALGLPTANVNPFRRTKSASHRTEDHRFAIRAESGVNINDCTDGGPGHGSFRRVYDPDVLPGAVAARHHDLRTVS